jgi:hypothetical protein
LAAALRELEAEMGSQMKSRPAGASTRAVMARRGSRPGTDMSCTSGSINGHRLSSTWP